MQTIKAKDLTKKSELKNKPFHRSMSKDALTRGISFQKVEKFKQRFHLTDSELAEGLVISIGTLRKLKSEGKLNKATSEKFYKYLLVLQELSETFNGTQQENEWMTSYSHSLENTPIKEMLNEPGTENVRRELKLIQVGAFS